MKFCELRQIIARELGQEQARDLAATICRECSGETVYFPKRPAPPEIGPRDTPKTIQARFHVCRQTAHNWLKRPPRR